MKSARSNVPAIVVLSGFALERAHYLFLETLFQISLGSWTRVDYVQARQSYDRLMGLGLVEIGRRGFEVTEKARAFFTLVSRENGSTCVEPRNADATVLIPNSPSWSNQLPLHFMYDEDLSDAAHEYLSESAS